jgi:GNAT superfamily N-acetyltransferase
MGMSEINVRMALSQDVPVIHSLIAELAAFEREPEAFVLTQKDLLQHGFEQSPPLFEVLLAESAEEGVMGMAMVYTKYSSWRGPCLFLEDLVVRQAHRRKGVGRLLAVEVFRLAADRQMDRVEWMVLDWNESAHAFYLGLGADQLRDWWPYRLSGKSLSMYQSA